jgi:hypothetical protein
MGMVMPVRIFFGLRNGKHGRLERADGQGCGEAGPSALVRACGLQEMSAEAYMRQQPLSQVCHLGAVYSQLMRTWRRTRKPELMEKP